MEEWRTYVNTILKEEQVEDMAIVGYVDNRCVWASKPGGHLAAISSLEIEMIIGQDRKGFLQTGITIAGKKYCVIRDNLLVPNDHVMDLRSKEKDCQSICIGMSPKLLIFLMGKKGVQGGILNKRMHDIIKALKK
ncbi:profilin-3 [Bufo gargarizans]|uniref:profilin-3 n=1 Tax=Bufo gargarizans TaxID=30331 RepID=UPI001CF1A670|nr:profilin-3 [Bufo gargarizans]